MPASTGKPETVQPIAIQHVHQGLQAQGFDQPMYSMTSFVPQLYVPGPHQPALMQHPVFHKDHRQGYMPVIDPNIGTSSIPH